MMLKRILLIFISLFSINSFSQEEILEFHNSLKTSSSNIKDIIPVVNKQNNEITIIITDAKKVYAYKFDENYSLLNKLSSEEKRRKFKTIIGSSIDKNGNSNVFLTNKKRNKFVAVNLSFSENNSTVKEFEFLNGEKFIQSFTIDNQFYILCGSKLTKGIYIYFFDEKGNLDRKKLDTHAINFINKNGEKVFLTDLLIKGDELRKFEENTPNSIENSAQDKKLFIREKSLFLTLDENKDITQILTIEIPSLKTSFKTYEKPLTNVKKSKRKSNSFINNNYLFTIAASKDVFSFEVLDLETGEEIKEYAASKSEKINFKNTPIIQEGGFYDNYRELEKTKKYLRKISSGKIGLSVFNHNNKFHLTMGGYVVQKRGGGMFMPGFGGIPLGSLGGVNLFFNPTQFAFNSFANSKSTRIESLFDKDFNHIDGEIKENAFDKMQKHKTKYNSSSKTEIIFKFKDYYIKGNYDNYANFFTLRKFSN